MIYLKAAIAATCLLLAALIAFSLIFFNSDYELSIAADDFLKGDYAGSEKILDQLREKIPAGEYCLYMAYNAREKNTLQESTKLLNLAEETAKNETNSTILLEIYLNQALNDYLVMDPNAMVEPIRNALVISKNNEWVVFFSDLIEYLRENYEPALKDWQHPIRNGFLSPWMKKTFEDTFTDFWFSTAIVRANIAKGNYLLARQKLEQAEKNGTQAQLNDINLMMGLSYLKEAEEKPIIAATPYYKLAFSYINRVPIQNSHYAPYRAQILKILQNQATNLIVSNSFVDLSFYSGVMEQWNDKAGLENMNTMLIGKLDEAVNGNDLKSVKEILTILNHLVTDPEKRQSLEAKFEELFNKSLRNENFTHVEQYWEAMRLFSPDPAALSRRVADMTAGYILQLIPIDDQDLTLTSPYLEFWMSMEKDPAHRYAFAAELLDLSQQLWTTDGQPEKALMLAKMASTLPGLKDQAAFHKLLEDMVNNIYAQAQSQNNPQLLHSIVKAKEELHLTNVHIRDIPHASNHQAVNQLKEASNLFERKHYQEAKAKAQKALELDPSNQKASLIIASAAYQQGHYPESIKYFQRFFKDSPNETQHRFDYAKALMEQQLFDKALDQIAFDEKTGGLSPEEKVALIACLVHLDRFKDADQKAAVFLAAKPPLPLADQIKMAKWMAITGNGKIYNEIQKNIAELQARPLDTNKALIELWIWHGDYEKASRLIKSTQTDLEKSSDGLLLIASLYDRLSSSKNALKFAQKALELDPYNVAAEKFIETHEIDLPAIKLRLAGIHKQLQSDSGNVTLQMDYAHALTDMAIEIHLSQPDSLIQNVPELNKASSILKDLASQHKDIPRLYLLLGESEFLQKEDAKAKAAFESAIKLDPSYSDAYKDLAMVYNESGQSKEAVESIKKSLRFNPYDAEAWTEMANQQQSSGDLPDAIASLKKTIKYKPNDTIAYINLGQIMSDLKEPGDARQYLETALKLSPHNIKALKLLLLTLHNPIFITDEKNNKDLAEQQQTVYNTLYKLDPKAAEELKAKFTDTKNTEGSEKG